MTANFKHPNVVSKKIRDAAKARIAELERERERLNGCLAVANKNHERFEREWYLAKDRIAELEAERDNLSDKLELERALTDGAHRRAQKAEARIAALEAALRKAMLWTDEENDVGPWRDEAEALLEGEK